MANLSNASGEILLGQVWPRRTVVALAYVLTVGGKYTDYGIWNLNETLQNADDLPKGEFKFEGCGRWTIANTVKDMLDNFKDWVRENPYGIGRKITDKEMLLMYQILAKDMLDEALNFTINYVDYEPGCIHLVSGMMDFKSNGTRLFLDQHEEDELPYTMRTMINEFGMDRGDILDSIDAATSDMDLDRIDRADFFDDILEAIMGGEADNLQPDPYWSGDDIPDFVLDILEKHLEKV